MIVSSNNFAEYTKLINCGDFIKSTDIIDIGFSLRAEKREYSNMILYIIHEYFKNGSFHTPDLTHIVDEKMFECIIQLNDNPQEAKKTLEPYRY